MVPTTSAYKEELGCNFSSAIPTNVFDPHDNSRMSDTRITWFHFAGSNSDLEDSHVTPSFIHKCYLAKMNGTPFIVPDRKASNAVHLLDRSG